MKETNMNFFSDVIKSINGLEKCINNGESSKIRQDKNSAILDYVVVSIGKGQYQVDLKKCKEVGISPEDAMRDYMVLKLKDISNEMGE